MRSLKPHVGHLISMINRINILLIFFCIAISFSDMLEIEIAFADELKGPVIEKNDKSQKQNAVSVLYKFIGAIEMANEPDIRKLTTPKYYNLLFNFGSWDSYKGTWPLKLKVIETKEEEGFIILKVSGVSPTTNKEISGRFVFVEYAGELIIFDGGQAWIRARMKHLLGPN